MSKGMAGKLHDGIWTDPKYNYPYAAVLGGRKVNGYRERRVFAALRALVSREDEWTQSEYKPPKGSLYLPQEFLE